MILSTDAEKFLSGLEGIGVVTSSAHTAVRDNVFRHCLRCHQPYMERDNGPRSCIIPHIALTIPAGTEIARLLWSPVLRGCSKHERCADYGPFHGMSHGVNGERGI